jgi:hypothetical protein
MEALRSFETAGTAWSKIQRHIPKQRSLYYGLFDITGFTIFPMGGAVVPEILRFITRIFVESVPEGL